jgi:sugar O-acyltransferase (sialic acid O-acetyltransferase NeuD family)
MEKILLLGASGHAKLIIDTVEKEGRFSILGLLDENKPKGTEWLGYTILGKITDLAALIAEGGVRLGIIAIGDNWVRQEVTRLVERIAPEFAYVSTIHPSAQIARDVSIGTGTVIMAASAINASAKLGRHCYVSTKASLDHDSVLEDFTSLGPGATVGGGVRIGTCSAIALGANVIHGVQIGEHTVIGAGAAVVRDTADRIIAYGVPAKAVRKRMPGDKYL